MFTRVLQKGSRVISRIAHSKSPLSQTPDIDKNIFLFIGGLHRSGTSIFHRLMREHPGTSGLASTGVPEDEGQHRQSVFPPARNLGGPGRFAFDSRSHLTETSDLLTINNRNKLLREWGAYYDMEKKILLEKSPPNLVRSRFFQALFPEARFVFIARHPIAVALASQKWANTTFPELISHWIIAYSTMLRDLKYIKNYTFFRYEDFVESPQIYLDQTCQLVGLDRYTPKENVSNHNEKYFTQWESKHQEDHELVAPIVSNILGPMEIFGYSLSKPYVKSYEEDLYRAKNHSP